MEPSIYLDNSATTPLKKEVLDKMMPYLTENYGNPSSIYSIGRSAKAAIDAARIQVANAIGAQPAEIYFTGAVQRQTTGPLRALPGQRRRRESTLFPLPLSTTRCSTP